MTNTDTGKVVYFVQAKNGMIKIGTSGQLATRAETLQWYSPIPLQIIGTMPGGEMEETALHRRFRHLHSHGEWFRPGEDLLKFIKDLETPLGKSGNPRYCIRNGHLNFTKESHDMTTLAHHISADALNAELRKPKAFHSRVRNVNSYLLHCYEIPVREIMSKALKGKRYNDALIELQVNELLKVSGVEFRFGQKDPKTGHRGKVCSLRKVFGCTFERKRRTPVASKPQPQPQVQPQAPVPVVARPTTFPIDSQGPKVNSEVSEMRRRVELIMSYGYSWDQAIEMVMPTKHAPLPQAMNQ